MLPAGLGVEGLGEDDLGLGDTLGDEGFLGAAGLGLGLGLTVVVRGGMGTWAFSTSFMSSVSER